MHVYNQDTFPLSTKRGGGNLSHSLLKGTSGHGLVEPLPKAHYNIDTIIASEKLIKDYLLAAYSVNIRYKLNK